MKKAIKILLILLIVLPLSAFVVFFIGRIDFFIDIGYRAPENYPNSTWSTRDENMFFTVSEEYQTRFEAPFSVGDASLVSLETNMYGEINVGEKKYKFFVDSEPSAFQFAFLSEEMPQASNDYFDALQEYKLLDFTIDYKSKNHFVLKVTESKISEIEVGEKIHFYRTE